MLKTLRASILVLGTTLILATALGAVPAPVGAVPTLAPVASPSPAVEAPAPALAQILGISGAGAAPVFLFTPQCIPLPVDCCQVGWNGHCRYCIHQDPSCGLP